MATTIRPELSRKNKYWLEKHRYYELKHFCLQYPLWKKEYSSVDGMSRRSNALSPYTNRQAFSDPTARCAEAKIFYGDRMELVKRAAAETDPVLANYILQAVTNGFSYDVLKARLEIPCCKDTYYELYRRFFWLLDKERG